MIKHLLTILLLGISCVSQAQFISVPNQTANNLVQTLVGNGISFSNATLVCGPNANAKFTNIATSLAAMDSGIVLTSGTTIGIGGPAGTGLSAGTGTGGDAQLSAVTGVNTFDVCKLEFDFIPIGDSIKFNYVFASDEYPGFACSAFGDVFGFFINGPGITGTPNIAVVPGTNIPITINSVNGSTNPGPACTNMGPGSPFTMYYVNNAASTTIAYNGMTAQFTAMAQVIPCSTYHLKLAIADGTDGIIDSGVFLKEGSLVSTPISTSPQGGSLNGINTLTIPHPYAVRNCLAGSFKFTRPVATPSPHTVHFNIGGSAVNGVDYIQIADSVVIPANQTQATVLINPVSPPSGTDSVTLYLLNPYVCGGSNIIDSVKLWIYDSLQAYILTNDTTICAGQSKQLFAYGDNLLAYSWTPAAYLNNPNIKNPIATPPTTTTFILTATLPGSSCPPVHDQVTITIPQLSGPPTSNSPICSGQTLNLSSPPGLPPGTIYSWTGPNGYSSGVQNPVISPASTLNAGTYTLNVTSNGCAFAPQTVTVVVNVPPVVAPTSNSPLCTGQTLTLFSNVNPPATYSWTGPGGFSSNLQNPTRPNMVPAWAGIYNVTVTQNGCSSNAAFTFVTVNPGLIAPNANNNGPLCVGAQLNLTTSPVPGANGYNWTGPGGWTASTQNPTIPGILATQAGNYIVTAVNSTTGCTSVPDTTVVVVTPSPTVTSSSFTNPTGCNSNTGTITFNVTPNGTYTGVYSKNGIPQPSASYPAPGGVITLNNLGAGTYTAFTFTINGCSVTVPGPFTLVDPAAPPSPVAGSNSPVCEGQTINLTASNVAGAQYNWTGPGGWTATNQQNPTRPNATAAMSGLYSVIAVVGGCQSAPGTVNVTVNPVPATPNGSGSNSPVCSGNPLNLTGAPSTVGASWSWSGPGGWTANVQNPTIGSATVANSGSYTVTANIGTCTSQPYTFNVVVNQTPSITEVHQNPSMCGEDDGSITLTVNGGSGNYTVNYTKNSAPQPAQTGSGGTFTLSGLTAGNYTNITVTQNGCTSNALGPVLLVDPNAPATPTASNSGPVCAGQVATLTAGNTTPGAIYIWTATGFSDTGTSVTATVTTTTTFSLVANLNGCNSTPVTTTVAVTPAPAAPTTTVNSPLCEGDNIYLTASAVPGATYYWSGPGGWTSNAQNPTITGATPAMSGDYYIYTDGTAPCPSMTDTVTVIVHPTPAAPVVVNPTEACQNTIHQLSAQGQNLLWYTTATGGTGVATMNANTTTATSVTYYVSQTINGCEGPRAPITIIVKPQPAAPVAQTNYVYCQFDTAALQLTATGNNLTWYDQNNVQLPGAPTPSTQVAATLIYFVTQTDSGCESNKTQIEVLINAKPALPAVEQVTVCQDEPSPSLVAHGQNLLWYDAATGGTGNGVTPTVSTADTGVFDYYVSQTVNGCESDRALLRVTVNPKVVADFSTDKDTVCDSYPLVVTFTGIAPQGATYDWSFDGATDVTGSGAGPYTVIWEDKGTKTITLTVTNLTCTSTITKTVTVLETPDPNFAIQPDACVNEEVRVQAAYNQMDLPGYNWNFGDAVVMEGSGYGPYTLKWTTTGQKVISMSLTNIPCPSLPHYDTINIHEPVARIMNQSSTEICSSDSVLFTAEPGLDYQYQWTPAGYFTEESNSMSMWGAIRSKGYVTLTVTDRWGCKDADSVLVEPKSCCEVFLPNTFTPNGDGKNDVFRMVTKGNQEISVFIIMDRWGKRVFESINQYEGWDGSYNGEAQDMGTYQYYLRYRCADSKEIVEMKGDVILLR